MTVFTMDDFVTWNGGSGVYRAQAVQDALLLAEGEAERWLQTPLEPTQFIEEYPWPVDGGKYMLEKQRLIQVDKVEMLFPQGNCVWQPFEECFTIFDLRQSIIRVRDPWWLSCRAANWARWPAERVRITYMAGFDTVLTTPPGSTDYQRLKMVVMNAALGFLQTSIGLNSQGNVFVQSFNAAGYSESRRMSEEQGALRFNNEYLVNAHSMSMQLRIRRFIGMYPRKTN